MGTNQCKQAEKIDITPLEFIQFTSPYFTRKRERFKSCTLKNICRQSVQGENKKKKKNTKWSFT